MNENEVWRRTNGQGKTIWLPQVKGIYNWKLNSRYYTPFSSPLLISVLACRHTKSIKRCPYGSQLIHQNIFNSPGTFREKLVWAPSGISYVCRGHWAVTYKINMARYQPQARKHRPGAAQFQILRYDHAKRYSFYSILLFGPRSNVFTFYRIIITYILIRANYVIESALKSIC